AGLKQEARATLATVMETLRTLKRNDTGYIQGPIAVVEAELGEFDSAMKRIESASGEHRWMLRFELERIAAIQYHAGRKEDAPKTYELILEEVRRDSYAPERLAGKLAVVARDQAVLGLAHASNATFREALDRAVRDSDKPSVLADNLFEIAEQQVTAGQK